MKAYLKIALGLLFWVSASFFSGSAYLFAGELKPRLIEGVIDNFHFKLNNEKQHCQLSINHPDGGGRVTPWFSLASQSPCYFFGDSKKEKIQTYSYPDDKIDYVLLIAGTAIELTAEQRKNKKMQEESYCTQEIQAIFIENGQIKLGAREVNAFACADDRLDEKMYQQQIKQPRRNIEEVAKELAVKQIVTPEVSFFESLQQKIEAIFKDTPKRDVKVPL